MILFNSDYTEGAHPYIMDRLIKTNFEQTVGYGEDEYCKKAKKIIKNACKNDNVDVHFLMGGTQTNLTFISAALRSHEGVLCADSGHINTHETGAIEATGHKVLTLKSADGKIKAEQVRDYCEAHINDASFEHTVKPKMVYISNPTEIGTIYCKAELEKLNKVCKEYNLFLYMDGARLGYGLTCDQNDLDLPAISNLCDAFYIGGTKVGALFGEALIISKDNLKEDFRYFIKQKGGLLAKGRLLGLQFEVLFCDNLYFDIAKRANKLAMKIKDCCLQKGYKMFVDSPTNQQFPILPNKVLEKLSAKFGFTFWEKVDDTHSAVRFCISWATKDEYVDQLCEEM